jgi:hydroxyacylglutathione hydrolase
VIDTRSKGNFAKGFIPGTINIQGNNAFATWMGWFISYGEPFILIAEESKLEDLTRKLMRIGLDDIYGYIEDVKEWTASGGKLSKTEMVSMVEFKNILKTNHTQIVDLRGATEYKTGHIQGSENIFVGTLPNNLDKIKKDQPVIIHCQSGDRSAIGYSLLAKNGFKNIKNYSGGVNEWVNSGNPVVSDQ